jgi:hypothetical protein
VPDIGLVNLNDRTQATKRAISATLFHREPNAMLQEPRGLVLNLKDAVQLASRDAFLRCAREMDRLEQLMKRDASIFEYGADRHAELLAAIAALVKAMANALLRVRLDLADAIHRAAMSADRTLRPKRIF